MKKILLCFLVAVFSSLVSTQKISAQGSVTCNVINCNVMQELCNPGFIHPTVCDPNPLDCCVLYAASIGLTDCKLLTEVPCVPITPTPTPAPVADCTDRGGECIYPPDICTTIVDQNMAECLALGSDYYCCIPWPTPTPTPPPYSCPGPLPSYCDADTLPCPSETPYCNPNTDYCTLPIPAGCSGCCTTLELSCDPHCPAGEVCACQGTDCECVTCDPACDEDEMCICDESGCSCNDVEGAIWYPETCGDCNLLPEGYLRDLCQTYPDLRTALGCLPTHPNSFIYRLRTILIGVGSGIALLMMIIGSFQILVSRGNPEGVKSGKATFVSGAVGLLLMIFAVFLLELIGVDILGLFY